MKIGKGKLTDNLAQIVPIYGDIDCPSVSFKGKQVRHDFSSGATKFLSEMKLQLIRN